MRKTFRHAGLLMMVGVIALGLLGAAYTLWYEDLSLTANVDTAQFDVDWSCQDGIDTDASNGQICTAASVDTVAVLTTALTPGTNPALDYANFEDIGGTVPDEKYIQTCSAAVSDSTDPTAANDGTGDNNVLTLTLDNLYPFAGCKFSVDIDMPNGTDYVPAHLTLTSVAKDAALKLLVADNEADECNNLVAQLDTETTGVINGANGAFQIHANEHLYCTFIVYLQEYDPDNGGATVDESGTYTLSATVTAHQWNEAAN